MLLVDNCSIVQNFPSTKLMFMWPSINSELQPMKQGFIHTIKLLSNY